MTMSINVVQSLASIWQQVANNVRQAPVKCIEVWKHGELTNGKQDGKQYELEALFFPFVIRKSWN